MNESDSFGPQRPGKQSGLGEDLEAVADPEHEPALAGEARRRRAMIGEKRAIAPQRR